MSQEKEAPRPVAKRFTNFLQEFSIPLIGGVVMAIIVANIDEHTYHRLIELPALDWLTVPLFGAPASFMGHEITLHFLINDVFMVLFFGVAAKEITEAMLPGGALNPPSKAINPLLGTLGGVLGPSGVYFLLTHVLYSGTELTAVAKGWGIPTATDIALAWLVARIVFGNTHPAVNFLLLLAVADDAIGLVIIAIFYPNPLHPVAPMYLLLVLAGMAVAFGLRRKKVKAWLPYVLFGGGLSWLGLLMAYLHPALALVAVVPFMPAPSKDTGFFTEEDEVDLADLKAGHAAHSPLHNFEHDVKLFVDLGLFFFAFANAGVGFASVNAVTWIVLTSLVVGKTFGITLFSTVARLAGFPLPSGMTNKHLVVAGIVAGLGLTVALFVAGEAFPGASPYQGPARMGAVLSASAAIMAMVVARVVGIKPLRKA